MMKRLLFVALMCGCGPSVHGDEGWPDWQGQRVGFWSDGDPQFQLVDVATGERTSLHFHSSAGPSSWTFAAGGELVVVEISEGWYESFAVSTGESRGLVAINDCNAVFGLAADPWGESVALASESSLCGSPAPTTVTIHSYDDAWTSRDIFTSPGEILEFTWAPAALALAVVHTPQPDRWVLTRVDVRTGASEDLFVAASPLSLPRLSPDASQWAVVEDDIVHMPTWQEQLDADVIELAWHPERDELVALSASQSAWVLRPVAVASSFGTYYPAETMMIGWPDADAEHPFLRGCGDGTVRLMGDVDAPVCVPNVAFAAWSSEQPLLLVEADEILVVDSSAGTLRSLGEGVAPRWASVSP
jgi:hypothetical protein